MSRTATLTVVLALLLMPGAGAHLLPGSSPIRGDTVPPPVGGPEEFFCGGEAPIFTFCTTGQHLHVRPGTHAICAAVDVEFKVTVVDGLPASGGPELVPAPPSSWATAEHPRGEEGETVHAGTTIRCVGVGVQLLDPIEHDVFVVNSGNEVFNGTLESALFAIPQTGAEVPEIPQTGVEEPEQLRENPIQVRDPVVTLRCQFQAGELLGCETSGEPKDVSNRPFGHTCRSFRLPAAPVPPLEPGEAIQVYSEPWRVNETDGTFTLTALADSTGFRVEPDEANNRFDLAFTTSAAGITRVDGSQGADGGAAGGEVGWDLAVKNVTWVPHDAQADEEVRFVAIAENVGSQESPHTRLSFEMDRPVAGNLSLDHPREEGGQGTWFCRLAH